jgi:hypothetical protein
VELQLAEDAPRLGRRIVDRDTLTTQIASWGTARHEQRAAITGQFAVGDARRTLLRLSPS